MTPGSAWKWPTSTAINAAASTLETREIGFSLLEKRAHRLFRLGRAEALAEHLHLLGDRLAHDLRVALLHQLLGEADRFRRKCRKRLAYLDRFRHQRFRSDD